MTHVRRIPPGELAGDWRLAQADALEAGVVAITNGLAQIDDLAALFDGDADIERVLGSAGGYLRTRRNDWAANARQLRIAASERAGE